MAVVPARGGSKGIPHKNIVEVKGKELMVYTLDAAKSSEYIDDIVVSTDDLLIEKVAVRENVRVIKRPAELAQDTSKTIDTVMHVIGNLDVQYEYLVLLQPTQPLRNSTHIDEAIRLVIDNNYPSLLSVSPVKDHPLLIRQMDTSGKLSSMLSCQSTVRRQDFPNYYVVNGAIYINRICDLTADTSLNDNLYGYEMPSEFDLDIDEEKDLVIFKAMLGIV